MRVGVATKLDPVKTHFQVQGLLPPVGGRLMRVCSLLRGPKVDVMDQASVETLRGPRMEPTLSSFIDAMRAERADTLYCTSLVKPPANGLRIQVPRLEGIERGRRARLLCGACAGGSQPAAMKSAVYFW